MKAATLTPCILKQKQKADKTWQVLIRLSYAGKSRYLPTSLFCTRRDLTSAYKIKNQRIIDECAYLVSEYRQRLAPLHIALHDYTIDEIVDKLKSRAADIPTFSEYFATWCERNSNLRGLGNYKTAFRSFCAFLRHDNIAFGEVTTSAMKNFEASLKGHKTAQHNYTSYIKRIFNEAKEEYNDEDRGIMPIRHSLRYTPPKAPTPPKKALSTDTIRQIFAMPYGKNWRRNLTLDLFRLSFALMGINAIDIYHCTRYEDGCIIYNRSKTAARRADGSLMVVRVDERIKPLFDKYRGKSHVFYFAERYNYYEFYRFIKRGIVHLSRELGQWVTFYSARHSMATIAVNEVGINKYIVNDMLCHKDPSMLVTDIYIKKDFKPMNQANEQLLDYVLGKK